MSTLTIRNVDDTLKTSLRVQAALHGRSMEEELRCILRKALMPATPAGGLGSRLVIQFREVAGDLPLPQRSLPRTPIEWDRPE